MHRRDLILQTLEEAPAQVVDRLVEECLVYKWRTWLIGLREPLNRRCAVELENAHTVMVFNNSKSPYVLPEIRKKYSNLLLTLKELESAEADQKDQDHD